MLYAIGYHYQLIGWYDDCSDGYSLRIVAGQRLSGQAFVQWLGCAVAWRTAADIGTGQLDAGAIAGTGDPGNACHAADAV